MINRDDESSDNLHFYPDSILNRIFKDGSFNHRLAKLFETFGFALAQC